MLTDFPLQYSLTLCVTVNKNPSSFPSILFFQLAWCTGFAMDTGKPCDIVNNLLQPKSLFAMKICTETLYNCKLH